MASILSSPAFPATLLRRLNSGHFRSQPLIHKQRKTPSTVQFSLLHELSVQFAASPSPAEIAAAGAGEPAFSPASYYTSLGLFVISVPGLWSLIKRSVKSKVILKPILGFIELFADLDIHFFLLLREFQIVQKNFVKEGGTRPNQVAGEILSFFTRNNFTVSERGDTITYVLLFLSISLCLFNVRGMIKNDACKVFDERFEGMMVPSRGQAALLVLCTCISLASVGLVLSIAIPEGGNNWFWLMILSPLA